MRESGDELGSLLRGYRAAFWTCFGFGTVGQCGKIYSTYSVRRANCFPYRNIALGLTVVFLRGIGIVGHQDGASEKDNDNDSKHTSQSEKKVPV
jgi:hypothetical protein